MSTIGDLLRDFTRGREVLVNGDGTIRGENYTEPQRSQNPSDPLAAHSQPQEVPVSTMKDRTFG